MARVNLGIAVALSCDVDPNAIDFIGDQDAADLAQYRKRGQVANSCVGKSLRAHKRRHEGLYAPEIEWEVELPDFAAWALGLPCPWTIPVEFPRPRAKADVPQTLPSARLGAGRAADDDEPNSRRRNNLLKVMIALAKAGGMDLSAPSKAAASIEALTRKAGRRVSARSIEEYLKQAERLPEDPQD